MSKEIESTTPKSFVFVLMPFDVEFDDIYKFGIKGAAEDVGAYAERVDEQIFTEGILERIFNQISKADVIVADMTGRNPNVFYEVGYAHALGKIVLLLTQNADDIPFDLKHRPHTVYAGKIDILREELIQKLNWAIGESKRKKSQISSEQFLVSIFGIEIPEECSYNNVPVLSFLEKNTLSLTFDIRNNSSEMTPNIAYIYLFTSANSKLMPIEWYTPQKTFHAIDTAVSRFAGTTKKTRFLRPIHTYTPSDALTKQFRLKATIPSLPPSAVERLKFEIGLTKNQEEYTLLMIRIHSLNNYHDFPFKIKLVKEEDKEVEKKD